MPDDKIKISALPSALAFNNTDEMPIVQDNGGSKTTKKGTVQGLGSHIVETMNFSSELDTDSNSIIGAINEVASDKNLADPYSSTSFYIPGQYCIYNTVLYKCITASANEDFDPTKWDEVLITEELGGDVSTKMDKANPTGTGSLAVGSNVSASGTASTALGTSNTASGDNSHAEGFGTTASALAAHAENDHTTASGLSSHAEGYGTIANHASQHVFGECNVADPSSAAATARGNFVEIVGNGANTNNRSNARTLDWDGNETLAGDLKYNGNTSISSKIASLETTEYYNVSERIITTWTAGYVSYNGTVHESTSYKYSGEISVNEGDKIYFYSVSGYITSSYRFLAAYNSNGNVVESKGGQNIAAPYVVPSGISKIIVTISNMITVAYGEKVHQENRLVPALKPDVDSLLLVSANAKSNSFFYEFDYTSGTTFSGTENLDDICGYRVCFTAKISSSVTGIAKIGKGIGNDYGGGIGFDGTNLYLYLGANASPQSTKAHGLTLKDYVSIVIDAPYKAYEATVTISTNGGRYEWTLGVWRSNYGHISFEAPDNYNECKISYTCEGLTKETWLYGDSYFSNSDNARWTKYLVYSGHTNYLLNGYGGRTSINAFTAFKTDLSMNRAPRRVVWCMGMNDKDTDSAPNASWLSALEEVISLCEQLNIELILATIPNVPSSSAKNNFKNAYVEASGYRYIDFAKAVSLNGDSSWYDNMLNSDNVHPNEQGAIALYSCAVSTVPELLF